MYICFPTNQDG